MEVIGNFLLDRYRPRLELLPIPYPGVAQEVLAESLIGTNRFIRRTYGNMHRENPTLAYLTTHWAHPSLDPNTSLKWALAYYEIYSRTARKQNKRLFAVSPERALSTNHETQSFLLESARNPDHGNTMDQVREKRALSIQAEVQSSEDLEYFWDLQQGYINTKVGYITDEVQKLEEDFRTECIFNSLYQVHQLLKEQDATNRMKQAFPEI